MAYTFDADPRALVAERRMQFVGMGTVPAVIDDVTGRLEDLWSDGPGGWPYEWSAAARAAQDRGDDLAASLLYGIAKYPCLGNQAHATAYERQLESYLKASARFPVDFERRILQIPYRGAETQVAVHLYTPPGTGADAPLVMRMGGVDSWKQDLHTSMVQTALDLQVRIAGVDQPGVGESKIPNNPDGDGVLRGVLDALRGQSRKVAVIGFSFGGYWAAKLALTSAVDAVVASGAPIDLAFDAQHLPLTPNGMSGILGNSLHRDTPFTDDQELVAAMAEHRLGRQGLLQDWGRDPVPMLVYNGADDPYVPPADVTVFNTRPNTITRLYEGAGHCAPEKMGESVPWSTQWLRKQLQR